MNTFFSVLASFLLVVAIVLYLRQVAAGTSRPNPATWFIWVVVTGMNTGSYFSVVQGDYLKWLMTLISAWGIGMIFLYSVAGRKFTRPGVIEIVCLGLAVAIGVFWRTTGDAVIANLFLQAVYLISFVPTIVGIVRKKNKEHTLAWDIGIVSYAIMIVAIVTDWRGQWIALAHPIANGIIGNGVVAIAIRVMQRKTIMTPRLPR